MDVKYLKNCQNNYKYSSKYEDDEFIIDKKIKRNYRKYKHKIDFTTDSEKFEEENEKQKSFLKNKSIKKVIEKFNRLSCNNNSKSQIGDDIALKPPEQIEFSVKNQSIAGKSEQNSEVFEKVSEYKIEQKCKSIKRNKKLKSSTKNSEKSRLLKYSGATKLRCSEIINNNSITMNTDDFCNKFKVPDEYIRFIDEVRRKNIIKYTPKNTIDNLQLSKNELKHFKSANTQTSPCPSITNILINVYNAPTPRNCNTLSTCNKSLKFKVFHDNKLRLSIKEEEPHSFKNDTVKKVEEKKSVKNCVQEFEEFMKRKDGNNDKCMDTTKKFIKYKSNHLAEDSSETLLSPKAKSVPF